MREIGASAGIEGAIREQIGRGLLIGRDICTRGRTSVYVRDPQRFSGRAWMGVSIVAGAKLASQTAAVASSQGRSLRARPPQRPVMQGHGLALTSLRPAGRDRGPASTAPEATMGVLERGDCAHRRSIETRLAANTLMTTNMIEPDAPIVGLRGDGRCGGPDGASPTPTLPPPHRCLAAPPTLRGVDTTLWPCGLARQLRPYDDPRPVPHRPGNVTARPGGRWREGQGAGRGDSRVRSGSGRSAGRSA